MNHCFKVAGIHYIYDIEGGSLLNVDSAAYLIAKNRYGKLTEEEEQQAYAISANAREEILQELKGLEEDGTLSAKPAKTPKEKPVGTLKALCLHICHDCNMRCAYCFANEGVYKSAKKEYMPFEVGRAAVDFLIENSGKRKNLEIDFFGGEPLLNFDNIKKIVEYARARETETGKIFNFTTTTNCLLLAGEKAEWLNREMSNVVLSIDGRRETNDGVRRAPNGQSVFDVVLKNALDFVKIRGDKNHYVRGTFTAKNLDFSEDAIFLHKAGFNEISVEPVVTDIDDLKITEEHLPQIKKEYEKLYEYAVEQNKAGKYFNFFHFMIDLEHGPCIKKRVAGCGSGCDYVSVLPNGDIYPCHRFAGEEGYLMGNVSRETFVPRIEKNSFSQNTIFFKPECENCFAKYHCSGGCAANNIFHGQGMQIPHKISCEMMKKRFELALSLSAVNNYLNI